MTIAEEPDDPSCEKTFVINSINGIDSPHTPVNTTFVIDPEMKYHKNMAAQKQIFMDRKKAHKRRTMFLLPPTPTTIRDSSKLNASDFEHKFAVETILKEIGLTKYINLFESEEVRAYLNRFFDFFNVFHHLQINIPAFLTLDDKDLQTIGIIDPEERCEIMKAVDTYQFLKWSSSLTSEWIFFTLFYWDQTFLNNFKFLIAYYN